MESLIHPEPTRQGSPGWGLNACFQVLGSGSVLNVQELLSKISHWEEAARA